MRKGLQFVESGMKLYQKWAQRKNNLAGAQEFLRSWANLETFCDSDPSVPLHCDFLQDLRLSVLCEPSLVFGHLPEALRSAALRKNFPCISDDGVVAQHAIEVAAHHLPGV